jgi:hypothetical protein
MEGITMKNPNEPCDVTITFFDSGKSVLLPRLSLEQQHALSALAEASGVRYGWQGKLCPQAPVLAERAGAMWRRLGAWMMGGCVIVALMLGAQSAFAQERLGPRAVEPIRVALTFEESEASRDFNEQLRVELNKLRRVVIVSNAVNFDVYVTAGPIVAGEKTIGYASAVAVVVTGARDRPIRVMLTLGPTPAETARRTARRINEQFSKGGK